MVSSSEEKRSDELEQGQIEAQNRATVLRLQQWGRQFSQGGRRANVRPRPPDDDPPTGGVVASRGDGSLAVDGRGPRREAVVVLFARARGRTARRVQTF